MRVVEDYKPLDVESATMALALCRGIRERYPEWRFLLDGDGGDENLKDYPIEENPELTIRSVVNNPHALPGGLGRREDQALADLLRRPEPLVQPHVCAPARASASRASAPSPGRRSIAVAEAIPFAALTGGDTRGSTRSRARSSALGVEAVMGVAMPVFAKRRFQHGALAATEARRLAFGESRYREHFLSLYA